MESVSSNTSEIEYKLVPGRIRIIADSEKDLDKIAEYLRLKPYACVKSKRDKDVYGFAILVKNKENKYKFYDFKSIRNLDFCIRIEAISQDDAYALAESIHAEVDELEEKPDNAGWYAYVTLVEQKYVNLPRVHYVED
jgi:hypothetical protein